MQELFEATDRNEHSHTTTTWIEEGHDVDVRAVIVANGWFSAIIKPLVAASAHRLRRVFATEPRLRLAGLSTIQPFLSEVVTHSEKFLTSRCRGGVFYFSVDLRHLLHRVGQYRNAVSRPVNPYDNASCESFMKTIKREEIYANDYVDLEHSRSNIEAFIDAYYNRCRLHSALGYQPPEEFEQQLSSAATFAAATFAAATMSFFRHGEDYRPDNVHLTTRSGPQTAHPTIGFDESPAGYSSASCSPAELASASPADADSATTRLV